MTQGSLDNSYTIVLPQSNSFAHDHKSYFSEHAKGIEIGYIIYYEK